MPRFSAPAQRVAHERVEDEVIAINLATGAYFSLRDSAADAWSLLLEGADADGVAAALAEAHGLDAAQIAADVHTYVAALVDAGLLNEHPEDAAAPVTAPTCSNPYTAPTIERYDDMEELLLLDPIHEVDDAGWPVIAVEPR